MVRALPNMAESLFLALLLLCALAAICSVRPAEALGEEGKESGNNPGEQPVMRTLGPNPVTIEICVERLSKATSVKGEERILAGLRVAYTDELAGKKDGQSSERICLPDARDIGHSAVAPCWYPIVKVGKTWPLQAIYAATMGALRPKVAEIAGGPNGRTRWHSDVYLVAIYPAKSFVDDAEITLYRVQAGATAVVLTREFLEAAAPKAIVQASGLKWAQKVPPVTQPTVVTVKGLPLREKQREYEIALRGAEYLTLDGSIVKIGERKSEPLTLKSLRVDGSTSFLTASFADAVDVKESVELIWPRLDLAIECDRAGKGAEAEDLRKTADDTTEEKK